VGANGDRKQQECRHRCPSTCAQARLPIAHPCPPRHSERATCIAVCRRQGQGPRWLGMNHRQLARLLGEKQMGGEMRETLSCAGGRSLPRPFGAPKPDSCCHGIPLEMDRPAFFIRDTRPIVMRVLHDSRNRLDGGGDCAPIAVSRCSRRGRPDHGRGGQLAVACFAFVRGKNSFASQLGRARLDWIAPPSGFVAFVSDSQHRMSHANGVRRPRTRGGQVEGSLGGLLAAAPECACVR
jgi:hypothetical protein